MWGKVAEGRGVEEGTRSGYHRRKWYFVLTSLDGGDGFRSSTF